METLVRWTTRSAASSPDQFLQVANDLDVVSIIDGFVLERALSDMAKWDREGLDIKRISVNVSAAASTTRN